jgi:hypothetical protein
MTTKAMMTALIQRDWHRVIAASISFPMRCPFDRVFSRS